MSVVENVPVLRTHTRARAIEELSLPELWERYWSTRDRSDRNSLLLSYESLVAAVTARLPSSVRQHWSIDDLKSFGLLGLVEAIERFEPESAPGRFPAYATVRIRGAIFDELRRLDWLPRTVRRRVITYRSTTESLAAELGRTPETKEVLDQMGARGPAAHQLLQEVQSAQLAHLEADLDPDGDGPGSGLLGVLASETDEPGQHLLDVEEMDEVRRAMQRLPERQRTVVSLHLLGGLTQEQIGAMLGVSNSRICQIEAAALQTLRKYLAVSQAR